MSCNTAFTIALQQWREDHKYTKAHMSKLLKLSTGYYWYIEKGLRQPSQEVIIKLLELTGFSPDVFFPINKPKINPFVLQNDLLETLQENSNLKSIIHNKIVEITNTHTIIYILEEILQVANVAISKKYSVDKYKSEIVEIAKKAIQERNISCDVICRSFGIEIETLKKWIGEDQLLFECRFKEYNPIYAATPEHAGAIFGCLDCIHFEQKYCKGFGVGVGKRCTNSIDSDDINVFSIIEDLTKKGITKRSDQVRMLMENYNFVTTEKTLNENIRKYKKGEHVPDSYKYMYNS